MHSSYCLLLIEDSIKADQNERHSQNDMQNIIDSSPQKKLFGRQVKIAGDCLIEIDQAEDKVEETHRLRPSRKDHQQSDQAENYVKHVVRSGAAG